MVVHPLKDHSSFIIEDLSVQEVLGALDEKVDPRTVIDSPWIKD